MNPFLEAFIAEAFSANGTALDLGAGDFSDVTALRERGWKCVGVDKTMGIDLEVPYSDSSGPFDLVYSNYVLHKIKNKGVFIKTMFNQTKAGGRIFLLAFDDSDKTGKVSSGITQESLNDLLKKYGFHGVDVRQFDYFDEDPGHAHWHRVLQATGEK